MAMTALVPKGDVMRGFDQRRGSGVALWRQIQEVLEGEIARGLSAPGEKLPTEFQLAQRFGVNRHTVRRALAAMEDKGLLRVEQGRGTFVHEHVIDYHVGPRTRFTENITRQSRSSLGILLGTDLGPAGDKVARALVLPAGAPVVRLHTAHDVDGRRVNIADHYLPADRFPDAAEVYAESLSITAVLRRHGVEDYTRKATRVVARMPSGADADLLRQPRNRPVLITEGLNVDPAGRPVEFGITRWASDWVQLVFET